MNYSYFYFLVVTDLSRIKGSVNSSPSILLGIQFTWLTIQTTLSQILPVEVSALNPTTLLSEIQECYVFLRYLLQAMETCKL